MEELIILALMVGAFYLLSKQRKPVNNQVPIITNSQTTQTEPITFANQEQEKDLQRILDTLIRNIKQLNHQIK